MPRPVAAEEFAGPFSSWRNLKTDYGAVGDGRTDDTPALQRALNDLVKHQHFCVLYIPAGHYRLTSTVKTERQSHDDGNGISLVGESPETTVLQWDGPAGGTVVQFDAWYARISRLTIDGAGRAGIALAYGPAFSTYNETSDLVLRDSDIGLCLGDGNSMGQAENEVLRCQFIHCRTAGVKTQNFNSLDIWVWYCQFEDCGYGMFNGAGAFHAWQSVFRRSTIADVGSGNLDVFSFVNNTSIGSRRFIDFDTVQPGALPASICGNHIINPGDDFPLRLGNGGPYLVMDNTFTTTSGAVRPSVKMSWMSQTLLGNTYPSTNAVLERGSFHYAAEKMAKAVDGLPAEPDLPPTPENPHRRIIEVERSYLDSDGRAIQRALDKADKFRGQRPIVHLGHGNYKLLSTLVIGPDSDVQLVGDGASNGGTCLQWIGPAGGLLLKLQGPSRAVLKDLMLSAYRSRALLVEDADQPGGRIFADQLNATFSAAGTRQPGAAIRVNGLVHSDALFRCLQGGGTTGVFLSVAGPLSGMAAEATNQIAVFTGGTAASSGHYELSNGARLVVRSVYNEHCEVSAPEIQINNGGSFSMDASVFAYLTSTEAPMVDLHDLRGAFTIATSQFIAVGSNTCRIDICGDGRGGRSLLLNDLFEESRRGLMAESILVNQASPPAEAGLVRSVTDVGGPKGLAKLNDLWQSEVSPESADPSNMTMPDTALLAQLAPLRETRVWLPAAVPPHVTDLQIYRVKATGAGGAVVEFRAGK